MSSQEDGAAEQPGPDTTVGPSISSSSSSLESDATTGDIITVTIGATVPTGFEHTAAEEVKEKIGVDARISKDRGRIYFPISTDKLFQVHLLRSVDNLFVVVEEYDDYQFKQSKEETAPKSSLMVSPLMRLWPTPSSKSHPKWRPSAESQAKTESAPEAESSQQDSGEAAPEAKVMKFRVTCNRAGDKHSFSSNEAARDFGGAVQEFFQWKADMTKFDIEVLLNIHNVEVVIGIALTEESLHRRNISHFGPTTLRSTLCYGMLRLCKPQASDIILDPMCGTGAIPLEGAIEFNSSFYVAGDNYDMAVNRTVNNICHIQKRRADKGSAPGLPIDTVRWDLCNLPIRTSSVDIIITDMPFGKRMGSRKKNWDLYPSCLREMARVCRPGSGKAVLLTQDKKCFSKAISRMGGLWRKLHTVWVNVGGLHAGVYLLKRTGAVFGQTPEDVYESRGTVNAQGDEKDDKELSEVTSGV
ncbi:THUMP domain-containing protein 3 [Larimichthys crocea]|uniref:Uncharacterized protein n=1 Tax=Larimichthys crocea TaxID=215358 RepID=A0ACD3RI78_LARCR|nr:THUMP domain-containing protein 3 [Larimichthys crocea]